MPTWNPDQYLRFAEERTRPCRDLVDRIALGAPETIIDLGCGPGNSTSALLERYPGARCTGLDSSAEMISKASQILSQVHFQIGSVEEWGDSSPDRYDLVFSNAALQWIGNHQRTLPRLFEKVAPGGAFAMQVPCDVDAAPHRVMREVAGSKNWRAQFGGAAVREWFVHEPSFYYDLLSGEAERIDLWETEYIHVLPDADAIVEWYKGTGLRPFLDLLSSESERVAFLDEYSISIRQVYRSRADGKVLFPFKRLFLIAYRAT